MSAEPQFREFVIHVARALAEEPERVLVEDLPPLEDEEGEEEEEGPALQLVVAPGDVGRLVGRRGRTANAMRTLLAAAGGCELEIVGSDADDDELEDDELE